MRTFTLQTSTDRLVVDTDTGRIVSLRPLDAPDEELAAGAPDDPAFVLQYLDDRGTYCLLDSRSAREVAVNTQEDGGETVLSVTFVGLGGLGLDVTLTVRASPGDRFSRWSAAVRNGAGVEVVDLQFPFVVLPEDPGMAVVEPAAYGQVFEGETLRHIPGDGPRLWQFVPEYGSSPHYPGRSFAQFLAWYTGRAGVYLACDDAQGHVKILRPARREAGIRLGVAHVGDWPLTGERTLPYEVLLGSFQGDWYDAADLYRDWGLRQAWATPLARRTDVPAWLLDSPPHITIRLQGYVDDGPAPPIEPFLPYEKCIPLLERVSARVEAPLVVVLMSWEHGGPWVYPDCFPPVGGEGSLKRFVSMARERGWHVGSFCNGTRWVVRHLMNGYDGRDEFERRHGEQSVCRLPDGSPWAEHWDASWRPSYPCCMAQEMTRDIAVDFVGRLISWGMESIQFFDQNCNAATFACFARDHGHPRIPGRWMTDAMARMVADFRRAAEDAGEPAVIQSTENPCNEFCLPLFQQSDARLSAPTSGQREFAPVFHYLYHECAIMHGMMSIGPEPYSLPIRTAWNGVLGEIPGAVLTGDGALLNRETVNWAPWEPKVGSDDDALEMLRTMTAMRRGPGRDYLVTGRMQRPAAVEGIATIAWEHDGRQHAVPAVAHAAWTAPDGRHGVVLANWTAEPRTVTVADTRLGAQLTRHLVGRGREEASVAAAAGGLAVTVPPLGCALVETATAGPRT